MTIHWRSHGKITLKDETEVCNLVIWPTLYEKQRRVILTGTMLGVIGSVKREGDVVHIVAGSLVDLSPALSSLGGRDKAFPLPHGRGDEFARGPGAPDPRDVRPKPRDIYVRDLHIDTLKQPTRNFR